MGRRFLLRTDHGSLTWLRNFREPAGQLARLLERLQELDFEIVHRRGKKHINADALSRFPCQQCGRDNHDLEAEKQVSAVTVCRSDPPPIHKLREVQLHGPDTARQGSWRETGCRGDGESKSVFMQTTAALGPAVGPRRYPMSTIRTSGLTFHSCMSGLHDFAFLRLCPDTDPPRLFLFSFTCSLIVSIYTIFELVVLAAFTPACQDSMISLFSVSVLTQIHQGSSSSFSLALL